MFKSTSISPFRHVPVLFNLISKKNPCWSYNLFVSYIHFQTWFPQFLFYGLEFIFRFRIGHYSIYIYMYVYIYIYIYHLRCTLLYYYIILTCNMFKSTSISPFRHVPVLFNLISHHMVSIMTQASFDENLQARHSNLTKDPENLGSSW
jgi:hypothetical protein